MGEYMKANRKFVNGEEAVSAVIGVILMVAITVAIAATVYVYVSGMLPGPTGSQKTVGAITHFVDTTLNNATFKVTQTDAGIAWADVSCKFSNEAGTNVSSSAVDWDIAASGANVAVGDYFTVSFGSDDTWIVDLVYKDSICWTSATVTT